MISRICVPLPLKRVNDAPSMIKRAEKMGADIIEIRLDYLFLEEKDSLNQFSEIIKDSPLPFIATNRQFEQGGNRIQDEKERIRILKEAAKIGFQYVDIELTSRAAKSTVEIIKDYDSIPIVSHHEFRLTPTISEMRKVIKKEIKMGGEVCKYIPTANIVSDNIRCLILNYEMREQTKIICFAMGRKGMMSRLLSPFFGSYLTYASLEPNLVTAKGQIQLEEVRNFYIKLGIKNDHIKQY